LLSQYRQLAIRVGRVVLAMTGQTKIRMLTSIAGSLTAKPGDVVRVDTAFALRLIDTNQAEPVDADRIAAQPEAAVTSTPETATRTRATSRSKRGRSRG